MAVRFGVDGAGVGEKKSGAMRTLVAVVALLLSATANAVPVTWALEGAVFDDGGTASGTFTYDSDLNLFTQAAVTTTAGSVLDGEFFSLACSFEGCSDDNFVMLGTAGLGFPGPLLGLGLAGDMTNAGGSLQIIPNSGSSIEVDGVGPGQMSRFLVAGSITAVPVPAAVWLFASALMALGWMRKRGG